MLLVILHYLVFFAFHFILPFILLALFIIHIFFLHVYGSNNSIGVNRNYDKIPFTPYFNVKDTLGFIFLIYLLLLICLLDPYYLGDPDNFIEANSLVTPEHIKPEWYFLFAYAILRSIPNKLGGVLALFMSILIFYVLILKNRIKLKGSINNPLIKIFYWIFIFVVILLTWIGGEPVEIPYILIGQILTLLYFIYFIIYLIY